MCTSTCRFRLHLIESTSPAENLFKVLLRVPMYEGYERRGIGTRLSSKLLANVHTLPSSSKYSRVAVGETHFKAGHVTGLTTVFVSRGLIWPDITKQ